MDGSDFVLSGSGHNWAYQNKGGDWTDYSFRTRVKLNQGGTHLVLRRSDNGRYAVGFWEDSLYLFKEAPWGTAHDLCQTVVTHSTGTWYDVEIVADGGSFTVFVDDTPKLTCEDSEPLFYGGISFETLEDSHVHFDDVLVVGEPPPEPPPGYEWTKTGGPLGGLGYDIRIHPSNKQIMFVTDNPSGVNKSYDAGKTWVQRNDGITSQTEPS